VDRGRRGELIAALFIMRACDAAKAALSGRRWASVNGFMVELHPPREYKILKDSFPICYRHGQKHNFMVTFKHYGIWFNHVIEVEKHKMILPNTSGSLSRVGK